MSTFHLMAQNGITMHRSHISTALTSIAALLVVTLGPTPQARAETWRQVGYFRSDTRNISVGAAQVRVVLLPDIKRLNLTGTYVDDSAVVERVYPGFEMNSDLAVLYKPGPDGFKQASYKWGIGLERKALDSDTVPTHLGVFDHQGTRRVKLPAPLGELLGDTASLVATQSWDWDQDGTPEWLVISTGLPDSSKTAAPQSIRLYDDQSGEWTQVRTFDIRESVKTGPLELRDVTGDGEPDFVYRYFHETSGHYWVDVRIISRHAGMPNVFLPAVFDPGIAEGPTEDR
jgi:hypothetical protein